MDNQGGTGGGSQDPQGPAAPAVGGDDSGAPVGGGQAPVEGPAEGGSDAPVETPVETPAEGGGGEAGGTDTSGGVGGTGAPSGV